MRQPPAGRQLANRLVPFIVTAAFPLVVVIAVPAQDDGGRGKAGAGGLWPRLPDAVTSAPDWIGRDAPFDVARYFAVPPRDRNAAPLYLDAFFEFTASMDRCFPPGPERDRRRRAADDRSKRYMELVKASFSDPNAVLPVAAVDEVIKQYNEGFRKLAEAQHRERCLFEGPLNTEIGNAAPVMPPHFDGARTVTRIASLRVQRAVQRGDFDAAIRDVETVLRLATDLRPRGGYVSQLMSATLFQVVGFNLVPAILASARLRAADCDRLLKALARYDAVMPDDGYAEGLRAAYLNVRASLRDAGRKQLDFGLLATPEERARMVPRLNDYYRTLLGFDGLPYARRIEQIGALKIAKDGDLFSITIDATLPAVQAVVQALGRMTATLRATECLVALRRWQLTHQGLHRSLESIVKEAGLKAVPIDPYDGKPMRLAVIGGEPVIYSVGKDGKDDGGLKDSDRDMRPAGDLLYRLPTVEDRPGIRPA
jgi:hypothetical protein